MATAKLLLDALQKTGESIQTIVRNFKKDSADRKTTAEYFEERIRRLSEAWDQFEAKDTELRILDEVNTLKTEHEYFTEEYYSKISELTNSYTKLFSTEANRIKALSQQKLQADKNTGASSLLQQESIKDQGLQLPADKNTGASSLLQQESIKDQGLQLPADKNTGASSLLQQESIKDQGLIRKAQARMIALSRFLKVETTTDEIQPLPFYDVKLATINKLWDQIEDLYDSICESFEDPLRSGFDIDNFYELNDKVQERLISLSIMANKVQNDCTIRPTHSNQPTQSTSSLHLPKVTIPKFDGDYLKWRQFYDLFSEMVDKQRIPAIQKMWYLKNNLSGEAEQLISQFSLSETNYKTAWGTLQDRYNNKRILVSNLVDKILNQQSVTSSAQSIKSMHDTTKECVLALNNLEIETATWDAILIQVLIKKLDKNTHIRYMQSLTNPRDVPTIPEFLSFLELQFQSMEAIVPKEKPTQKAVSTIITSNGHNISICKLCNNSSHKLYHCNKFRQLSEEERLCWVQRQNLCVNCFGSDHASKNCKSSNCRKCGKRHNTLLHLERKGINQEDKKSYPPTTKKAPATNVVAITSATTNVAAGRQGYVLLATARVMITSPNGASEEFRAVLDSGSQVNIVSKRLCQKLSISPSEASLCLDGVGEIQKNSNYRTNIQMKSRDRCFSVNVEAYVLPSIIPAQPSQHIDISSWDIPNNIHLADPHFDRQEKIDLLLGAEFYYKLTKNGTIHLADDLPTLQNTTLGWIVGGAIGKNPIPNPLCALTCAIFENNNSLEEAIEHLWKLDEIETSEKVFSPSEKQCESHFTQHIHTDVDGRFIASLPFRENPTALGESHTMAYNRFMGLERRLLKNEDIRTQYIKFMQEYEKQGHMQKVNIDRVSNPKYFIPHHSVLKPDSTTTKLRVVFDASAKTSSGLSLNDLMYTGPTVQSELFSILLRFRLPKFVFTTDIEKMYRQILLDPDNQQYQLIIWREDPGLPISYYKLNTVTYGTRAAPYLATRCLTKIADENIINYPFGAHMLKNNFYVDDGLGGSDSLNIALETQKELITILKMHGFNLKKWCANHPLLLKNIPPEDQEVDLDFNSNNTNTIKTLGLLWLPKTDQFCVKVKINHLQTVSKRTATSDLAKLFDPLGLLAPVVVKAKMFIQKLWQLKLDWDDSLPEDLHGIWTKFRNDLDTLNNFKIPRHILKGNLPTKTELHIFSDASEKAFGAVAYIRATLRDKRVIVQLLCAKTRVAPLKQQTLPRLELCAAVMAAQLVHRIETDLQIKNLPLFLWTDSEIVLSWINAQSSLYHTFVANRVSKIQSLTLPEQWRHVRSKDNPADILSRGLPAHKLSECNLWFYGPLFLHGQEERWPPRFMQQLQIPNDTEKKKTAVISAINVASDDLVYKISHKNSFRTLQRVLGYTLRFIRNSRKSKEDRPTFKSLTPAELDEALSLIIKTIQMSDFSPEINQLRKNKEIDKKSSIISLSPFLDESNIVRVGGRLEASLLSYDAKHPMLIPYNDPLTKLLFTMFHEENKHCGPQALLSIVRQRFWPIKGKIMARSTVQKCIKCARARPQLCQQIMGNLPQTRVTPARPFINAGVDYCGPFWIHYKIRGKRPTKAYIAVFCCFSTKAVHLELVSDLSTDAFIGALKRFIGRRGRCKNIYSDNATNFIGAKNQLSELADSIYSNTAQESIISTSSSRGIHFHFIPPRAPHFGGLWEAAVKSAKHLLLRSVATASLTHEEMETVVVEIEAILNSRPLTPMSNDPNDLEALTPGHFLIGEALTSQIDSNAATIKMSGLSHWSLVSRLKQNFWKQWSTEYLNQLQQRYKWNKQFTNLKVGDMVVIKEDNLPVMKWPLGRIVQIYPGDDGGVRVVEVKTSNGLFKRLIHRVALLPIDQESEASTPTEDGTENINNSTSTPVEEPKAKKMKMPTNHLTLALLTTLLLLPLVIGSPIENKKFGSRVGIHFEQIGTAAISTTEWNLLVYYDLASYWSETSSLINGTRSLENVCKLITTNTSCLGIIDHFRHMERELQLDNRLLRVKRGALDLVGNIAHSLFGVLDSEYADQMSETIKQVNENESYLLKLLKNQTSIVDSTINIIRQNQITAKARFEQLEQEIKIFSNDIHDIKNMLLQVRLNQLFNSAVLELTLIANNIKGIQTSILDTLMDTHHGQISPWLLTPEQLQNEVNQITLHLPPSMSLPVTEKTETLQLFKLMKVKGRLTHQHAVFKITLPLIENEKLQMFHLIPVPNIMNKTMVSIKPCATFLGISASHEQYVPFTNSELSACDTMEQGVFLCSNIQIRYNYGSEVCTCEINLFNNKTTPTCILEKTNIRWIPLSKGNQWIYASSPSAKTTAVCNREIIPISLKGSGLLTLDSECILKHEFVNMNGRKTISSTLRSSYTSLGKISDLILPKNTTSSINYNEVNSTTLESTYAKNIKDLTALQRSLEQHDIAELPNKLKSHQMHSHTIGYLALILSSIAIIILLSKCKLNRNAQKPHPTTLANSTEENIELQPYIEKHEMTPLPMPRQHSKFSLDV